MAEVRLTSLTKEFPGGVRAVDGLDLTIHDGEFFALLGPSGCGKTTLLRTIAGLETPTGGTIHFDGEDVTKAAPGSRNLAMVFQDYALYPHMTVVDNVAYPLKVRKIAKAERHEKAGTAAENLQLGGLLERRPGQLSGGQQQRVALARAIAYEPGLFLFDEPLSNLDARLRLEARTFLKRLQRDLGVTTVYVTHDQSEALALADRMAVMDHGRFRQVGSPAEVYERPSSRFVAGFIGSIPMSLVDAVVSDGVLDVAGCRVPVPDQAEGHVSDGQRVTLGLRPEYATLSHQPIEGGIEGQVAVIELLGTEYLVTIERGDVSLQVTVPTAPDEGETAWISIDRTHALVYRDDDGLLAGSQRDDDAREVAEPSAAS